MADWGVSVYLGSPDVPERLPAYLKVVAARGGRDVFTSLHIPEVPLAAAVAQMEGLTRAARELGVQVVADIAPGALAAMGAAPENLGPVAALGLSGVRLDYGFGPEAIARFARNEHGLRIVLNASTVDPEFLTDVMAAGANPALLEGCHNYYPRPETGLSPQFTLRSSQVFRRLGLRVAAFVAGQGIRRGPLHQGLPTVERHRHLAPGPAAAALLTMGEIDTVLVGDPWATEEELDQVSHAAGEAAAGRGSAAVPPAAGPGAGQGDVGRGVLPVRVRLAPGLPEPLRRLVVEPVHANRPDAAEQVVRSTASRSYAGTGNPLPPFQTAERPTGSVTIDNEGYLRYAGELQITLQDLVADRRVNVVARVIPEDVPLLRQIGPGAPFRLVAVDDEGVKLP